jgi:hypothetical protein
MNKIKYFDILELLGEFRWAVLFVENMNSPKIFPRLPKQDFKTCVVHLCLS